ncbi:MAG: CotH kinase family protein [Bacteroidales bacterium]|nr:CotH kinase family protein [Bacteroidales bacterium]
MKKLNLILLAVLGLLFSSYSQNFYDINNINTVEITFVQSNWDYLLDQLVANGQEERLLGTVAINGEVYDSVGVRYKGNSSYNPNQVKNPLNIKLDYVISDQEIEGYGTLKLANAFKDPSFIRETVGYELARKYFPASQANYTNVYINGTHLGLYTSVQDVDKYFMRTHFSGDEGARIKGEIESGIPPNQMGSVWEYYGSDSSEYFNKYALESDFGWNELVEFLDTLNNHNNYVDKVLNIDRHLWFLAFQNLTVNLDSPINNPQNYYIFKDEVNRFNPIPWDLNECFGVFTNLQSSGNLNTYQLQHLSPFVNLTDSDYPIISKILSNDSYRKMYVAHMKTMIENNFSNNWYEERALEIQDIIAGDVQGDPNKFYSYNDFLNNINNSVGGGPNSVIGITQLMETRVNYISGLSDFQAQAPEILNTTYSPTTVLPNTEVWFNTEVESADNVYLGYRKSITQVFEKIEMFDDGNHQDGVAGDGIYGISIISEYSDIEYYIYADNNNAASFSPPNAEFEYYSISVTGDLVINEFMADNETTVVDQDGEYDDWIELYNNSDEDIPLLGFFLSDDASSPDQWAFPDTSISSGGYLIVWADKDEEQEGLHASFKLSASGETILLSDSELNVRDEISYEQQYPDTTTGRFPNGTGDFVIMLPTFAMENQIGTTQIIELNEGFKFVSTRIEIENPDMLVVLENILGDNLDYVRNTNGSVFRKIGPNWVNGIGDWITKEGYLFKMNGEEELSINGESINPQTPIDLYTGFQFVSYLPEAAIDALIAFEGILTDDLDYIRNSYGGMLRKIGPNWVNGIGDANPGEGYLIKMFAEGELIYNIPVKSTLSSLAHETAYNFDFKTGNAADPVYTLYVSGLNIGDEIAVFDGNKIVGTSVIASENVFENSVPVFSTLTNGNGYEPGNPVSIVIWDSQNQTKASATYTFDYGYEKAYAKTIFPSNDGEFSVINISKNGITLDVNTLSEISVYPNPASDQITVNTKNSISGISTFQIFNLLGEVVYSVSKEFSETTSINISQLEPGLYFIKVENKGSVISKKFIKK